jgi:WG containing repeat
VFSRFTMEIFMQLRNIKLCILIVITFVCGFANNNYVNAKECDVLFPISDNNGKDGYIDCKGNIVVNPIFQDASEFKDGVGRVITDNEETGIIKLDGTVKLFTPLKLLDDFSEDLGLAVDLEKNIFFIDKAGDIKISLPKNTMFAEDDNTCPLVSNFSGGIANVKLLDGSLLFIDNKGNKLFSLQSNYERASDFSGGISTIILTGDERDVFDEGKEAVIDNSGLFVINPRNRKTRDRMIVYDPVDGLVRVREGKTNWKYYNKLGKVSLECAFDYAGDFVEELAVVEKKGKYGFINRKGKPVIPIIYDIAEDFSEGLAIVEINGKQGFINKSGKFLIPPKFDVNEPFKNGLAYVQKGSFEGYINKKGRWIWKKQTK